MYIQHLLPRLHANDHLLGVLLGAADAEALHVHVGVDARGEVGLDGAVDAVAGPPLRLLDDDGVLPRHAGAQAVEGCGERVAHLGRQQLARQAADEHQGGRQRGRRGDGLVVGRCHGS
uniref:Uncharacterized protein n=1 Tax=Triticum urartu TaxID=4572 RepID=A0A8R7P896_TRIUA